MINDRKNIDNLFADGLKTYRAKAPVHAWDSLSTALDKKQSRTKFLYVRLLAASVAILLAFGAGYFFANYNKQMPVLVNQETPELLNNNQVALGDEVQEKAVEENIDDTKLAGEMNQESPIKDNQITVLSNSENTPFASTEISNPETQIIASTNNLFLRNEIRITPLEMIPADNFGSSSAQPAFEIVSKSFVSNPEISIPEFTGVEYTYGGGTGKKETMENKWTVGAHFAPTYSYREISASYESQSQVDPNAIDYLNENEEALRSYAGGVNIDLALNKRWGLQSGIYYSRIGQVNNDALEYAYNGKDGVLNGINTSTGSIKISIDKIPYNVRYHSTVKDPADDPVSVKIEQNFDFFEVPFLLNYKVINRKFSVNLNGGLSPAYLVENKTYLKVDNEKYDIGDAANLNSLLVNTSFGLGLEYRAFKNVSLSFEPTFKYSLISLNKDSQFYYHPYSLSWFTGVKFSF